MDSSIAYDGPDPKPNDAYAGLGLRATYSPEDNKLRLHCGHVERSLYERLKTAGFIRAYKQGCFVAPMWTPDRADVLIDLCGEIGDEDTTLASRADDRADRFEGYHDNRAADAQRARAQVQAITENIPLGQPILVGHHSERHARRDAERIENGLRRAVQMWETAEYWKRRAAGAIRHAKYKEQPGVRARRIKTIEADKRKQERSKAEAEHKLVLWSVEGLTLERARRIAAHIWLAVCRSDDGVHHWTADDVLRSDKERSPRCPAWSVSQVQEAAKRIYAETILRCERWIAHCDNRLIYEHAMLEEQGAADLLTPQPRTKLLPLCNYRAPEGLSIPSRYHRGEIDHYAQVEMTQREYAAIGTDYKGTRVVDNSHRVRTAMVNRRLVCVFLTDSKVHERPAAIDASIDEVPMPKIEMKAPTVSEPNEFQTMKDMLKQGIQVVSAPQLFPTPAALARRMVALASNGLGMAGKRVLEPNVGTGRILQAIIDSATGADCCTIVAVEINRQLCAKLEERRRVTLYANDENYRIICADFLECGEELGAFDAIVMNPPFEHGQDVIHVTHGLKFLKPGGRLVAAMSNGLTFRADQPTAALRALIEERGGTIELLPDDSFKESGTNVRTVLVSIDAD